MSSLAAAWTSSGSGSARVTSNESNPSSDGEEGISGRYAGSTTTVVSQLGSKVDASMGVGRSSKDVEDAGVCGSLLMASGSGVIEPEPWLRRSLSSASMVLSHHESVNSERFGTEGACLVAKCEV